jgi:hypothetical protein
MPVINLARQCFSSERRNVAYPVVSAQGSTPPLGGENLMVSNDWESEYGITDTLLILRG